VKKITVVVYKILSQNLIWRLRKTTRNIFQYTTPHNMGKTTYS